MNSLVCNLIHLLTVRKKMLPTDCHRVLNAWSYRGIIYHLKEASSKFNDNKAAAPLHVSLQRK